MSPERRETLPLGSSEAAFETRDFYLACFLRCVGYPLLGLRDEGRWKVLAFRDQRSRCDDVIALYGDTATVKPQAFVSAIKDIKGLLHNG